MGKINDALQRAEQQRAEAGGATVGPAAVRELVDRASELPSGFSRGKLLRAARRSRLVLSDQGSSVVEQYRTLRARIESIRRTREIRSIAITSTLAREGKTTTSMNLALSFGLDVERKTCLIDCDLRTPGVHRALSNSPPEGLAEVLQDEAKLEDALVQVPDTLLWVVPVRLRPSHPSELLASRRMSRLLDEVYARFETVLIDSPPVVGLPDATTLVDLCDACVFVVSRARASRMEIETALERIDAQKIIGTVFNRSPELPVPYGYGRD